MILRIILTVKKILIYFNLLTPQRVIYINLHYKIYRNIDK